MVVLTTSLLTWTRHPLSRKKSRIKRINTEVEDHEMKDLTGDQSNAGRDTDTEDPANLFGDISDAEHGRTHQRPSNTIKNPPVVPDQVRQPAPPFGVAPMAHPAMGFTPENTIWDVYNNEARVIDTELVKDWTSSLNFLLVFAAIFSAILTAFIIESKKMLEQDPSEVMKNVLIFYTNNLANGSHTPYIQTPFTASHWAVVVNCLFFASLSVSIVAALASVIALQWVAEYDAAINRGGASPEDRVKRRQFRFGGVLKWKMSEIIAALPILLYISVALFFAGVIEWMWKIHVVVGNIVLVGAMLVAVFYIITTALTVVFPSSPFRSPIVRWIHILLHTLSRLLYAISCAVHLTKLSTFLEWTRFTRPTLQLRDDDYVLRDSNLAFNALMWLATHLSLSIDSYRRFFLLAREALSFTPQQRLRKSFRDAPWPEIFGIIGSYYVGRAKSQKYSDEDVTELTQLVECLRNPQFGPIIAPRKLHEYSDHIPTEKETTLDDEPRYSAQRVNIFYCLVQNLATTGSLPVNMQLRHRLAQIHRAQTTMISQPHTHKAWASVVKRYEDGRISRDEAMVALSQFIRSHDPAIVREHAELFLVSVNVGHPIMDYSIPALGEVGRRLPLPYLLLRRLHCLEWIHNLGDYPIHTLHIILEGLLDACQFMPVWRFVATDEEVSETMNSLSIPDRDPASILIETERRNLRLVEVLNVFDKLPWKEDHLIEKSMTKILIKGLEVDQPSLYRDYFTEERRHAVSKLENPRLQMIACACAGLEWEISWMPKLRNHPDDTRVTAIIFNLEPIDSFIDSTGTFFVSNPRFLVDRSTIWQLRTRLWWYLLDQLHSKVVRDALNDIDILKSGKGLRTAEARHRYGGDHLLVVLHSALRIEGLISSPKLPSGTSILALLDEEKEALLYDQSVPRYCSLHIVDLCRAVKSNQTRLAYLLNEILLQEIRLLLRSTFDTPGLGLDSVEIMRRIVSISRRHLVAVEMRSPPIYRQALAKSIIYHRDTLLAADPSIWNRTNKPMFLTYCIDVVHGLLSPQLRPFSRTNTRVLSCPRVVVGNDAAIGWLGLYTD